MKISEIITDKYKLRIPPTVYYELLADVREVEEDQEPFKPMVEINLDYVIKQKYIERDVLDKIRAEIEKLQKMCDKNDLNLMAQYSAFGMVLDILDKYKAESEDT